MPVRKVCDFFQSCLGQNENIIWLARCTVERVKSVAWAETESEVQGNLPAGLLAMGESC